MVWTVLVSLFRSRGSLKAELLILRHQLNTQRRHQPKRLAFSAMDRLLQTSVAKYMALRRGPPSQGWKTLLRNHADGIVAMDLLVVSTLSFRLLYGLVIMGHGRRRILWFGATGARRPNGSPISSLEPMARSKFLVT
jgi:hypothetical protein